MDLWSILRLLSLLDRFCLVRYKAVAAWVICCEIFTKKKKKNSRFHEIYIHVYILYSYGSAPMRRDTNQRPWGTRFSPVYVYIYILHSCCSLSVCVCMWAVDIFICHLTHASIRKSTAMRCSFLHSLCIYIYIALLLFSVGVCVCVNCWYFHMKAHPFADT